MDNNAPKRFSGSNQSRQTAAVEEFQCRVRIRRETNWSRKLSLVNVELKEANRCVTSTESHSRSSECDGHHHGDGPSEAPRQHSYYVRRFAWLICAVSCESQDLTAIYYFFNFRFSVTRDNGGKKRPNRKRFGFEEAGVGVFFNTNDLSPWIWSINENMKLNVDT